jgi:alcohol dehydrogenase
VGVDVSIGAVGYPETLLTAASLVRPSGAIASVGVYGVPVSLPMQDMWIQNVTLTMGLVDTVSIPTLLKMVASGRIPAEKMALIRSPSPRWTRPTTCLRTPPRTPPSRW